MENPAQDREYTINCKRKVVQFVYRWVVTIRHPVFDDVVSMSFLEVTFVTFLSDATVYKTRYILDDYTRLEPS